VTSRKVNGGDKKGILSSDKVPLLIRKQILSPCRDVEYQGCPPIEYQIYGRKPWTILKSQPWLSDAINEK